MSEGRRLRGKLIALGVALAVLVPLGYFWATSHVPGNYSAMDMGYADYGGGPAGMHQHHGGTSVTSLAGPAGSPSVVVMLVARKQKFSLASGESVDGFTLNGTSPGPLIRARLGDLVQVTLVNESVSSGVTLHWHGVDVPNAEDGVAGITQDAVPVGGQHVYRFRASQAGTYWYHSHQVSSKEVRDGLFGPLVIGAPGAAREVVAAIHTYDGKRTINGHTGSASIALPAGTPVRVRVINTDNSLIRTGLVGTPYKVLAVDGRDLVGPTLTTAAFPLAAGARVDLEASVPEGGALRLDAGSASLVFGTNPTGTLSADTVDLLTYGTPSHVDLATARPTRTFDYRIGRRIGFLDGKPGLWWTINGHKYPDVPMFMVSAGDIVRMRISNTSGQSHPMHLHGHHALVLTRNGTPSTGTPWWTDTLEVANNETYEIAFHADNPGIWMDHCHNLPHATEGLMTHLAYFGVTTPYRLGGPTSNKPE
ncbi:multicopper oxidase family protein [Kribbella monticola]|uniref:multicopper oxidase family protein n=1 Tax=Kribbella monticola TaxID=2185285 RepID=UPI001E402BAA|nr:multicopper oxidase family protein [Kribbella monticola]